MFWLVPQNDIRVRTIFDGPGLPMIVNFCKTNICCPSPGRDPARARAAGIRSLWID
jgi:hypothetical protein